MEVYHDSKGRRYINSDDGTMKYLDINITNKQFKNQEV